MFTIESIKIKNIRSIGEATFSPLTDGSTALNGVNGAGKSTVVASLLFALYGVTPDGVPVKAMRRQDSAGECKAVVTLHHDGQTIEVERGLKGSKDDTYASIKVDGKDITNVRPKAATAWITNRFGGLTAEGFLTAFVVRQKELDGLVKARPADRRKLIERLAGIDRMSEALAAARKEATEVADRLKVLPGSAEELKAARDALEQAQQNAVTAWERFEEATVLAERQDRVLSDAEDAVATLNTRIQEWERLREVAIAAQSEAREATSRAEQAAAEVQRLTAASAGGTEAEVTAARAALADAELAAQENRSAREAAERAAGEASREAAAAQQAADRAQRARTAATSARKAAEQKAAAADRAKAEADQAQANLPAVPADADQTIRTLSEQVQTLNEKRGALLGEFERLNKALATLSEAKDPECPTCLRGLDDADGLIATLAEQRDKIRNEGVAAKAEAEKAAAQVETLRQEATRAAEARQQVQYLIEQAKQAAAQVQDVLDAAATAESAADEAEAEAATARTAAQTAADRARAAQEAAATALAAQEQVTARVAQASAALRRAENAAEALTALPQAEKAADQAAEVAQAAQQAFTVAADASRALLVSEEDKQQVREAYAAAQRAARETSATAERLKGEHAVAEERVGQAERARDAEEAKLRARAETVAEQERKATVVAALDDFRKDRIARLAPELSEVATDFVCRMTDGKYVAVELDEEFTPVLTDSQGRRRPVSWLSGGEESAVALALRVAIGELIAGQRGGVLFLDEVLTAQDGNRRPAMMGAIRELPGRQIVTINHVTEATDMVDLVLDVLPDEDNGSTIQPAGTGSAGVVSEALLDMDDEGGEDGEGDDDLAA